MVQTENSGVASVEEDGGNDLGVPLEVAKLEEAVARVEAQLAQAAVSEPPVAPAPEPTLAPPNADSDDELVPDSVQETTA